MKDSEKFFGGTLCSNFHFYFHSEWSIAAAYKKVSLPNYIGFVGVSRLKRPARGMDWHPFRTIGIESGLRLSANARPYRNLWWMPWNGISPRQLLPHSDTRGTGNANVKVQPAMKNIYVFFAQSKFIYFIIWGQFLMLKLYTTMYQWLSTKLW